MLDDNIDLDIPESKLELKSKIQLEQTQTPVPHGMEKQFNASKVKMKDCIKNFFNNKEK